MDSKTRRVRFEMLDWLLPMALTHCVSRRFLLDSILIIINILCVITLNIITKNEILIYIYQWSMPSYSSFYCCTMYFWNYVDILESPENYMYNMDFSRVLFFFKVQYQTKIYCSRIKRSCTKFLTFWLQQGAFYTGSSIPLNLQPFQVWIRVLSKQRRRNNRFLEADRFRWCGR